MKKKQEKENWKQRARDAEARADSLFRLSETQKEQKLLAQQDADDYCARLNRMDEKNKVLDLEFKKLGDENERLSGEIASGTRIIDRQRELLILYERLRQYAEGVSNQLFLCDSKSKRRHSYFGADKECIALDSDCVYTMLWGRGLSKTLAAITVDIATGKEAR